MDVIVRDEHAHAICYRKTNNNTKTKWNISYKAYQSRDTCNRCTQPPPNKHISHVLRRCRKLAAKLFGRYATCVCAPAVFACACVRCRCYTKFNNVFLVALRHTHTHTPAAAWWPCRQRDDRALTTARQQRMPRFTAISHIIFAVEWCGVVRCCGGVLGRCVRNAVRVWAVHETSWFYIFKYIHRPRGDVREKHALKS